MVKKILITGENSYIGTSFSSWMEKFKDNYEIDTIDLKNSAWQNKKFSDYDAIFHVAGIAHADVSKVNDETKQLYYDVNTHLTEKTALKYKNDLNGKTGIFIFMSSIIIYGDETNVNRKRIITAQTKPSPSNFYGDSKLQAENKLTPLQDKKFKVAIVRPPMIYGPGSKGNYAQLEKIANKVSFFPKIKNERSMLYINNLTDFIKGIIDNGNSGIYFPQDDDYVCTSEMVQKIAQKNGKKIYLVPGLNWAIKLLGFFPGKIGKLTNKAFGNLVYEKNKD